MTDSNHGAPEGVFSCTFTGTRRHFLRGVAAAGAWTMAATALGRAGMITLGPEPAEAATPEALSQFAEIPASSADVFEVPQGFRADVLLSYGDPFADSKGNTFTYGYNGGGLSFFPLDGEEDEGLLFIDHEYTNPFYLHGYKPGAETPPDAASAGPLGTGLLDGFDRADGALGPNWTASYGTGLLIDANQVKGPGTWTDAVWNTPLPAPHEAFCTLVVSPPNDNDYLYLMLVDTLAPGAGNGYALEMDNDHLAIHRHNAGAPGTLLTSLPHDENRFQSGDKIALGIDGDFVRAYRHRDGAWTALLSANDTTHRAALMYRSMELAAQGTAGRIDDFGGKGGGPTNLKTRAEIDEERAAVGNSILHVRRGDDGVWGVVSPSSYNRRIYGGAVPGKPAIEQSTFAVTGPLAGHAKVGATIVGTIGNRSGGRTPWGTALSCEGDFEGFGLPLPDDQSVVAGWADPTSGSPPFPGYPDYHPDAPYREDGAGFRMYGWVCEHDPYDSGFVPRKHTALGRFRHQNAAFRHVSGKPFVVYMSDGGADGCVYKFVSDKEYLPNDRAHNLQILQSGTLYVARWQPEGRRRFADPGDTEPVTAESGAGTWVEIPAGEALSDPREHLEPSAANRGSTGTDYGLHYATNGPGDLEVGEDGEIYLALKGNSSVNDAHGCLRRLTEEEGDPAATAFSWTDYADGGPSPGGQGFSNPNSLAIDSKKNVWVATDISSGSLHNNALFMVPAKGSKPGRALRFANMPVQAEGAGTCFSPDESALFINVQHPGEQAGEKGSSALAGQPETFASYWPEGDKTAAQNPSEPLPSTVVVTRVQSSQPGGTPVIPPPAAAAAPAAAAGGVRDTTRPRVELLTPRSQSLRRLRTTGLSLRIRVSEPATVTVTMRGRLAKRGKPSGRSKTRRLARGTARAGRAGVVRVRLRPSAALRVLLRRERALPALLEVTAVDAERNRSTRTKRLSFR